MPNRPGRWIERPELLALTALALLTRFLGLFDPRAVVWDEIHFERFAGAYLTNTYYVDVHPPLGKLLLAFGAKILGVSGAALAAHQPAPFLRVVPAVAGALIIPVSWLLLVELGAGRKVATIAAAFLLFDNALLVESRFVLMDSMLLLFGVSAVLLYAGARRRAGASRWRWLAASAVAAGMAASVKWTGLSALGLILLALAAETVVRRNSVWPAVRRGAVLVAIPVAVYVGSFAVHFALLGHSGPDDDLMSPRFQTTLEGNATYSPTARVSFTESFVEMHRLMGSLNARFARIESGASSPWYTWPIAKHSIGFWSQTERFSEAGRWIILFANPVVWWGALFGMIAIAAAARRRSLSLVRHRNALLFLTAGYLLNFVPFAFIHRPMYLYHYFFALIFSVMLAACGVGCLAGWMDEGAAPAWTFASRRSRAAYWGLIGLAALAFVYLSPMSYGRTLSAAGVAHRRWILERHW